MKIIILPIGNDDQEYFKFFNQNRVINYNYENYKIIPQKGDIMISDRDITNDSYYFKVQSRNYIWDKHVGEPNTIYLNVKRLYGPEQQ